MLKRPITPKSRKKCHFWSRDKCLSLEIICHSFLMLNRRRMPSESKYCSICCVFDRFMTASNTHVRLVQCLATHLGKAIPRKLTLFRWYLMLRCASFYPFVLFIKDTMVVGVFVAHGIIFPLLPPFLVHWTCINDFCRSYRGCKSLSREETNGEHPQNYSCHVFVLQIRSISRLLLYKVLK